MTTRYEFDDLTFALQKLVLDLHMQDAEIVWAMSGNWLVVRTGDVNAPEITVARVLETFDLSGDLPEPLPEETHHDTRPTEDPERVPTPEPRGVRSRGPHRFSIARTRNSP